MRVGIIGAGMSGLSAAHFLNRKGVEVEILEADSIIGGFAHSFQWNGHTCDWSAHRLFTHDEHILQLIQSLVPLRTINRVSAVHLGGKWLKDPVDVIQLCTRFFPRNTFSIPWTYLTRDRKLPETSFQSYCFAHFGTRLEEFLFSPYTQKMFGIPMDQMSVEWARKKLRLSGPLDVIRQGSKTKFNYFYYPKNGSFGTICNAMMAPVRDRIRLNARMTALETDGTRVVRVRYEQDGQTRFLEADQFISTIPLTTLCSMTGYEAPLSYRGVSAVYVLVNKPQTTPNHWIYYMDGDVAVNRLCEIKNLYPQAGPPETSVVCAEVTDCGRPDYLEKTIRDLAASGIFRMDQVLDSTVVRREFAYPVYRCDYEQDVDKAMEHLARFHNLHTVGRAAQFEHMEVDDCLESALQCVRELTVQAPVTVSEQRSSLAVEPKVATVIADTGEMDALRRCVDSFLKADYSQQQIVVVTHDEARQTRLRADFPAIQVLQEASTRGLSVLYNKGIVAALREHQADFVLLVQSNTHADPDLPAKLVRVAQRDPEAGILAPQIRLADEPGNLWSIGLQFRHFPPSTKNIGRGRPAAEFAQSREVEYAVSSGLLISREALEKAGLFDPGFSCFYEDMDFSRRVRQEGFRIRYVPEARLYYHETPGAPDDDVFAAWGESFTRFYRRHMSPLWLLLPLHFTYLLLRETLSGNSRRVPALGRGMWKGLHRRLGRPPTLDSADTLD
jgi:protoporphyrinogen oxidase/GT2 family glycosyltransferase